MRLSVKMKIFVMLGFITLAMLLMLKFIMEMSKMKQKPIVIC